MGEEEEEELGVEEEEQERKERLEQTMNLVAGDVKLQDLADSPRKYEVIGTISSPEVNDTSNPLLARLTLDCFPPHAAPPSTVPKYWDFSVNLFFYTVAAVGESVSIDPLFRAIISRGGYETMLNDQFRDILFVRFLLIQIQCSTPSPSLWKTLFL